jgi:acetyl-CoA acetyltransferase
VSRVSTSIQRPDDAVIVAARRSPIGKRGGALAAVHPHDLLGVVQNAAIESAGITASQLDMIVAGCVTQMGDQAYNIGRMASLR